MILFSKLHRSSRRLLIMLGLAWFILASALIIRTATGGWSVPAPSKAAAPSPLPLSAEAMMLRWQNTLQQQPENTTAYAMLGLAYLERMRESGDPTFYDLAQTAFDETLARDPRHLEALIGQGMLALGRHDFQDALTWAEQARAINPYRAQILGIFVDAQVELGQYEAAVTTLQQMVDMRPDITSYSRVSYLRELYGDAEGAITAMQTAVKAGQLGSESRLWTQTQLGHLYFKQGDLDRAEETYHQVLRHRPNYIHAQAGLARLQAARGHYQAAIQMYRDVVERLPLVKFVLILGDLYDLTEQPAKAKQQYDLARAIHQLNAAAGVDITLELALFEIDYGADPVQALQLAQRAYEHRPIIYAADALAWALYHTGRYEEARSYSQEALRLGTHDALLYYHAGSIAGRLGDTVTARTYLQQALAINPYFSLRYVPQAQARLKELP